MWIWAHGPSGGYGPCPYRVDASLRHQQPPDVRDRIYYLAHAASTHGLQALGQAQAAVISNALAGNDSLVVMATGGGKSICYQLPPLVSGEQGTCHKHSIQP